jgi:hypothetical protein
LFNIYADKVAIDAKDAIEFVFRKIEPIREDDAYNNFFSAASGLFLMLSKLLFHAAVPF